MIDVKTIDTMKSLGGSFVRSLAEAWLHADWQNKKKLEETFSYFEEYDEIKKTHE